MLMLIQIALFDGHNSSLVMLMLSITRYKIKNTCYSHIKSIEIFLLEYCRIYTF